MNEAQEVRVPEGLKCPRCQSPITEAAGATPGHCGMLRRDQIILCNECGLLNRLGESSLIPLTLQDIKALPKEMQRALAIVVQGWKRSHQSSN